jgi:hypothetical protein
LRIFVPGGNKIRVGTKMIFKLIRKWVVSEIGSGAGHSAIKSNFRRKKFRIFSAFSWLWRYSQNVDSFWNLRPPRCWFSNEMARRACVGGSLANFNETLWLSACKSESRLGAVWSPDWYQRCEKCVNQRWEIGSIWVFQAWR